MLVLNPVVVDTAAGLAHLVAELRHAPAIAVDTESNSLFAYRERLCLVQISAGERDWLVDPLAGVDLAPLAPVFADPRIVKVFHDAEYDVLTLKRAHAFAFASLFDTKVAACSLGMASVGLAALLLEFYGVTLDKKLQRSDWGRRPLSDAQLDYARCDTHWLVALGRELRGRVLAAGELHRLEVEAECRRLEALVPGPRVASPDEWVRVKGSDTLDGRGRRALKELHAMRERIASERDQPPFKVLGNEALLALARAHPRDPHELRALPDVSPRWVERWGSEILATLAHAQAQEPLERPQQGARDPLDELPRKARSVYDALRIWRKRAAGERGTDPSLILPRGTMLALALLEPRPETATELATREVLESWRVNAYGEAIVAAMRDARGPARA